MAIARRRHTDIRPDADRSKDPLIYHLPDRPGCQPSRLGPSIARRRAPEFAPCPPPQHAICALTNPKPLPRRQDHACETTMRTSRPEGSTPGMAALASRQRPSKRLRRGLDLARIATSWVLVALVGVLAQGRLASASPPSRGKLLFLRCASCHDISSAASPKIGPNLAGVYERRAGSLAGYSYSPALASASFKWDAPTLDRWLAKPSDVVPGTAMAFGGISSEADRQALISYLRQHDGH